MATATLISVETYLHTSYRPDCDYVDGEVEERTLGTKPHGLLQSLLAQWFNERFDALGCTAITEQRVQVSPARVRIPDVCVVLDDNHEEDVIRTPPLLAIEILSPEDRLPRLQERITDYMRMGVPNVWVIDPVQHAVWNASGGSFALVSANDLRMSLAGVAWVVDLAPVFVDLQRRLSSQRRSTDSTAD